MCKFHKEKFMYFVFYGLIYVTNVKLSYATHRLSYYLIKFWSASFSSFIALIAQNVPHLI